MTILRQLQADFQQYLLEHDNHAPAIHNLIRADHGLSAQARLDIYHRAYRVRLHDALSDGFTKCHIYLGDTLFQQLALSFIQQHPSHFRNLRWYGGEFPHFLREELPDLPQVAELAQFEWALGLAFDAADTPVLQAAELSLLQEADWGNIGFDLISSVQFLSLQTNTPAVWLALNQENDPPDARSEPQIWMVWRKQLQAHFRSVSEAEYRALSALQNGVSFAAVCSECAERDPDASQHIGSWLHNWLQDGVLSFTRFDRQAS